MDKYCSECGTELSNEDLFCPECGTQAMVNKELNKKITTKHLHNNLEKYPKSQLNIKIRNYDLNGREQKSNTNTKSFFNIRLSIIILVSIILIVLCYFFFIRDSNQSIQNVNQNINADQKVTHEIINSSNLYIENSNSIDLVSKDKNVSINYSANNRFDNTSKFVLISNRYNRINIYNIDSKKSMQILGFDDWVTNVCFSPNNEYLLTNTKNGKLNVIDIKNWKSIGEIFTTKIDFQSICFDPTGNFLGVPQNFGAEIVKLNSNLLTVFKIPTEDKVTQVTFSNSGSLFAVASYDRTIKICSMEDGSILQDFKAHHFGINSIVFSKDDRFLISASIDKTIRIWDVKRAQLIKYWKAHQSDVNVVAISSNGKSIASGSYDNTIKIWSFPEGNLIKELFGHSKGIRTLSFSPNSDFLYSEGWDGIAKLWDLKNFSSYEIQ